MVTTYFWFLSHIPPGRSNVWCHQHYFEYLKFKKTETKPLEGLACPLPWKIKTAEARKLCKLQDTEFPNAFWELLGHWQARAASSRVLASKASTSGASTSSLTCPTQLRPPASTAPPVAFIAVAKAAHSCGVAAREQSKPKFRLPNTALALTWISAWKSSRLVQGNALDSGWSFAPAVWQESSSAEGQQKCFTGSCRAGATPQGHYLPQLLPTSRVNWWTRHQDSAYNITPSPSHPTLKDQLDLNPFARSRARGNADGKNY